MQNYYGTFNIIIIYGVGPRVQTRLSRSSGHIVLYLCCVWHYYMCNSRLHGHTRLHGCMLDHDAPTAKINYHTCTKKYNTVISRAERIIVLIWGKYDIGCVVKNQYILRNLFNLSSLSSSNCLTSALWRNSCLSRYLDKQYIRHINCRYIFLWFWQLIFATYI